MKKFIFVLCIVVFTSIFCMSVSARTTIEIDDAVCSAGESIMLNVLVTENPGMCYLSLTPVCNDSSNVQTDYFSVNVVNGSMFSIANGINPVWDADNDVKDTGLLCTLTIDISENTPAGVYTVSFIPRGCYNYDEEDIEVNVLSGTITVKSADKVSGEMLGAQARNEGIAGLRFGTRINVNTDFLTSLVGGNTYDALGVIFADGITDVSFGTLVVPQMVLDDNSFTADNLTHALMGDIDVANAICKYIYSTDNDGFIYTAVLTGIPDSSLKIAARSYVKYTENGETVYYYFDPVVRSVDDVISLAEGAWEKD